MGDYLKGKVAIVTGSGMGIGRAVAKALAAEGCKVVTNNRTPIADKPLADGDNLNMDDYEKLSDERKEWFKRVHDAETGDAETTAAAIRAAGGEAQDPEKYIKG